MDAQLASLASSTIHSLCSSGNLHTPISSFDLLRKVVSKSSPTANPRFRLTDLVVFERILQSLATKQPLIALPERKSTSDGENVDGSTTTHRPWPHGTISLSHDAKTIDSIILGFPLPSPLSSSSSSLLLTRGAVSLLGKRKRVRDEDDDSAAGGSDADDERKEAEAEEVFREKSEREGASVGALNKLSGEMKEVYRVLQRETARGRLLAEEHQDPKPFEPVCPHITKGECAKHPYPYPSIHTSPSTSTSSPSAPTTTRICPRIHFRPLIRPHTDPNLGHCSYLNTCYSEPTYAHSPSISRPGGGGGGGGMGQGGGMGMGPGGMGIHPGGGGVGMGAALNSAPGMRPVSLPSGLGAGGRGKEKAPCRYLHFEVDWDEGDAGAHSTSVHANSHSGVVVKRENEHDDSVHHALKNSNWNSKGGVVKRGGGLGIGWGPSGVEFAQPGSPQWINCDLRKFDYSVLGKFHVIMADPPWDIHMSLPYGTMTDDEMRAMPIPALQDEGLLFLWVTGRAMEVGRECLRVWGYTRVDEVIWVKTNQLQRVIRTGRTGHWLNHTKEHMLVGLKNPPGTPPSSSPTSPFPPLKFPSWINRSVSTDVIVSEVRETSRKPDEVYGVIERMCPGGRKIEIFGRKHNVRPGWLTLGNQLGEGDRVVERGMRERIGKRYPERDMGDEVVD